VTELEQSLAVDLGPQFLKPLSNNTFSAVTQKAHDLTQNMTDKNVATGLNQTTLAQKLYSVADLHDRFKGEKESYNGLEEKARKRKEQQRKKLLQQSKP